MAGPSRRSPGNNDGDYACLHGCILSAAILFRLRWRVAAKLPHPLASCTNCGAVTHNDDAINTRCDHMMKGVRCNGVYQSRPNLEGWQECSVCSATGCTVCRGTGWIAVRRSLP